MKKNKNSEGIQAIEEEKKELLLFAKWAILQFQGDSGAGHGYWNRFPEYMAGIEAIAKAEGNA